MRVVPYGEGALYVDLEIDEAKDRAIRTQSVASALRARLPTSEVVVGAGSLAVVGLGAWDDIESVVTDALHAPLGAARAPRLHTIRAVYDGPDLEEVARLTALSVGEIAEIHAGSEYAVELIGFLPGFAYLTPVDPRLVVPRRDTPRSRVEPRSLAIAGPYTGIYPLASPGGWRVIGRVVDTELFDAARDPPALFEPGDRVRFIREGMT